MEFVEGHSLKERLDTKEPVPLSETVRLMEQVLAGLQFSHDKGVVHRDIKPGNVMLTKDGHVKLADFGIARIESSVMTQAGTMLGTPGLHVAGTVDGAGGGRPQRHLFVGRAAVSVADR